MNEALSHPAVASALDAFPGAAIRRVRPVGCDWHERFEGSAAEWRTIVNANVDAYHAAAKRAAPDTRARVADIYGYWLAQKALLVLSPLLGVLEPPDSHIARAIVMGVREDPSGFRLSDKQKAFVGRIARDVRMPGAVEEALVDE